MFRLARVSVRVRVYIEKQFGLEKVMKKQFDFQKKEKKRKAMKCLKYQKKEREEIRVFYFLKICT